MDKENSSKQYDAIMNAIKEAIYDLSDLEKDVFYMVLDQLRDDDPDEKRYRINLDALEQRSGKKATMPELEKAAKGLLYRVYKVKEEEAGKSYLKQFSLVTAIYMGHLEEHSIGLEISFKARPYLLALKKTVDRIK
jgi:hypothetical protein